MSTTNLQMENAIQNNARALQGQASNLADSQLASQEKAGDPHAAAAVARGATAIACGDGEQSKSQLLAETNAKESTYEKLLAAAEAQVLKVFRHSSKTPADPNCLRIRRIAMLGDVIIASGMRLGAATR